MRKKDPHLTSLRTAVTKAIKRRGLTYRAASELCGVPHTSIFALVNQGTEPLYTRGLKMLTLAADESTDTK